jgi:hypothetical protein
MTLRQLIRHATEFNQLDEEVQVRLITRDEHGSVTTVKVVPINYFYTGVYTPDGPGLSVEMEDVNEALEQNR